MMPDRRPDATRARIVAYIRLLGPLRFPQCAGSMLPDLQSEDIGWACILCTYRKIAWRPSADGAYVHLRPRICRALDDDQVAQVYARFAAGARQIDIVREFRINRLTVCHLRRLWDAEQQTIQESA